MAIFQPTNIIPSISTNSGTVSIADTMQVQWQVNGNSAMTAFQIDVYKNDALSTFVKSTGKITVDNLPSGSSPLPFYGTDRLGKPQFFTYSANGQSWEAWSMIAMTDGNNYKLKIIQWFSAREAVVSTKPDHNLAANIVYYFAISGGGYVSFAPTTTYSTGDIFCYNAAQQKAWVVLGSNNQLIELTMTYSTTTPTGTKIGTMTADSTASSEDFIQQTSASPFITRTKPTVTLQICATDDFADPDDFTLGTLSSSIGYFHAKYEQGQNDPVRWVQWQVASATYNEDTQTFILGDILTDTNDIYTPELDFEFNGFFVGKSYAIRCLIETEKGQQTYPQGANTDGWIFFTVKVLEQGTYSGTFTAQYLPKENAALLEWEGVEVIEGIYTEPESEEVYSYNNGAVMLPAKSSIIWNKVGTGSNETDLNFFAPWTAVWKGEIGDELNEHTSLGGLIRESAISLTGVYTLCFNSPGTLLVVGCNGNGNARLYRVDSDSLTYISNITDEGYAFGGPINCATFSPNDKLLSLANSALLYLFSFTEQTQQIIGLYTFGASCLAFNQNGNLLIAGSNGYNGEYAKIFSVTDNTMEYLSNITKNGTALDGAVNALAINGSFLVLGGDFTGKAALFSITGTSVNYISDITLNGKALTSTITAVSFNPSGNLLVLSTLSTSYVFSVDNENIDYVSSLSQGGNTSDFSPDGKLFAISRIGPLGFSIPTVYLIEGNSLTLLNNLAPRGEHWGVVNALKFSPVENVLVLGGAEKALWPIGGSTPLTVFKEEYKTENETIFTPRGILFVLNGTGITLSRQGNPLILKMGDIELANFSVPDDSTSVAIAITPTTVNAFFYADDTFLSSTQTEITYTQQSITSVEINGGDNGVTVKSVSVYKGDDSNIIDLYMNYGFEPVWNSDSYDLYMTANFNSGIGGGTGNAEGNGFRIYRQEYGSTYLTPIANLGATTTSLKDYGLSSCKAYQYYLCAYDNNNAYMGQVQAMSVNYPKEVAVLVTNFKNYSLMVCSYDDTKDEYHIRKQYLFALNLTDNGASNNNTPTINANFTPYPTIMKSVQNYKSGTLSGLIGTIYTKQAVVEQIGNYKRTVTPSTLDYFDSVDLEKELYDLSVTPYTLFLRDMKGHLRMVQASGAITQTPYIKSTKQQITISFPWVEIGDASDVTIIQTPEDYGWDYDNQVLEVELDVDVETGMLYAKYPYPYNGSKFYLTGAELSVKTPKGITPAKFEFPKFEAPNNETNDGEVTATVTINTNT